MADADIIDITALRKTYDDVEALRGMTLHVPAGSIYGLLGPNGAGKTTALKALMGLVHPSAGDVRVFGLHPNVPDDGIRIRQRTAFVSDDKSLYDYMTVEEMIRFTASFFPKWRPDLEQSYLRSFDLPRSRPIKALSQGTRTKLALLLALCRGAELLVLDEPTSGLDPVTTEAVLQAIIGHVAASEMTVLFSTHQIAEVEQVADHVAILHRGQTALSGSLDELHERFRRIQLVFEGDAPVPAFTSPGVVRVHRAGRVLTVLSSAGIEPLLTEARRLSPISVDVTPVALKDIFMDTVRGEA